MQVFYKTLDVCFIRNMDKKRYRGTVKWFSPEKGFGFISVEDREDIFVYYTDILSKGFKVLNKGQAVEFEIAAGDRGLEAKRVKIS
jgi:CspA family cold shock protein